MTHVKIRTDTRSMGPVEVNGIDVAPACLGYQLVALAGHPLQLTLDVILREGVDAEGEPVVAVPEKTRRALVALGWTPPPAEEA